MINLISVSFAFEEFSSPAEGLSEMLDYSQFVYFHHSVLSTLVSFSPLPILSTSYEQHKNIFVGGHPCCKDEIEFRLHAFGCFDQGPN